MRGRKSARITPSPRPGADEEQSTVTIADQPDLSNDELRALLDPRRAQYTLAYDEVLSGLERKRYFDREDLDRIAGWKFGSMPQRLQRTRNLTTQNSDRDVESLTSRAFRCNDDLGALLLVELLHGVGKAFGSAILMAHDPSHYRVIDVNAVRAIQAVGYLRDCPRPTSQDNSLLAAARDVSARTGWTLRNVDRALYHAGQVRARDCLLGPAEGPFVKAREHDPDVSC
jgi:hypothetical protein